MKIMTLLSSLSRRQSIRTHIVVRACASFLIALFVTFLCALPLAYLADPKLIHFYFVFLTGIFTILLVISLTILTRPWPGEFSCMETAIRQEIHEPLEEVVRKIKCIRSNSATNQEERLMMIQDTCAEIMQIQDRLNEYILKTRC